MNNVWYVLVRHMSPAGQQPYTLRIEVCPSGDDWSGEFLHEFSDLIHKWCIQGTAPAPNELKTKKELKWYIKKKISDFFMAAWNRNLIYYPMIRYINPNDIEEICICISYRSDITIKFMELSNALV